MEHFRKLPVCPHDRIANLLECPRNELLAGFSDTDGEAYIHLVDWLRESDVASRALRVGDPIALS